ncbi:hypothetical protein PROFUN_16723 [Planoprotostelium fungivorum]|uniref:Uncharacterized protein n=1 Tax=Planoprotostelium fungivorum TaxID=1890364 RepID=A0A2P6MPS1_9EUKA|nr:hypothetical protein PROFUN_16723 [Planoprotostelium fungivorum]
MTAAPLKRCTSILTLCYAPHLSHPLHLPERVDGTIHLNTNTPANTGPFSNTRGALQRAAAHNRKATTIDREVEPHLNKRDIISAPSHLEAFAREKQENSLPYLAQTSAEIQRDTISETGGSDTQNRVSAGNLSHLQLRLLSTTTRVTLHLRHDSQMFDAHLRLPLHPTETI